MDDYQVQRYIAGDIVFREGDEAAEAFLIMNGSVSVSSATEAGSIPLGDYAVREVFGEVAIVNGGLRDGTAQMRENGELVAIPAAAFHAQLNQAPPIIRAVIRSIAGRLVDATQRLKPGQDRSLFYAMAHLLYQMNLALSADRVQSLPYDRAMKTLTAVLSQPAAEIEAVLQQFEELDLIGFSLAGRQRPQLIFKCQDGFLGKALHHYDRMHDDVATDADDAEAEVAPGVDHV